MFLIAIVVLSSFFLWYKIKYSMDVAGSYEVNSADLSEKLLIATQGSEFKNTLTSEIVDHFRTDSIFIKIIDISLLSEIDPVDFRAIVIIHTWEYWKPPAAIKAFIHRTEEYKDQIVVLTTSGEGSYRMEDVDAVTAESTVDKVPLYLEEIKSRLRPLIKRKD